MPGFGDSRRNGRNDRQQWSAPYSNTRRGAPGNSAHAGDPTKKIFVGNLSWEVAWQDLKDHFKPVGEVLRADVLTERTGRSKGCGVVEFASSASVQMAIDNLNGSDLKGRTIFVNADRDAEGLMGGGSGGGGSSNNSSSITSRLGTSGRTVHMTSSGGAGASIGVVNAAGTITNGRLYLGNLDYGVDWKALKDHIKAHGGGLNLLHVDVPGADTGGRSRGYGIAEYGSNADALHAMELLHDTELNGRKMFAREDKEDKGFGVMGGVAGGAMGGGRGGGSASSRRIFVGNLSFEVQWQELKDFCRRAGNVLHADIPQDSAGRSRGFGLVEFESPQEAAAAINILNEQYLRGRNVHVREDRE